MPIIFKRVVLFLLFSCFISFSQETIAYHKLYEKVRNIDLNKAKEYAEYAINFNDNIESDSLKAISFYNRSEIYFRYNLLKEARIDVDRAIALAIKGNNQTILCLSYIILGRIYREEIKYTESLKATEKALNIAEELENNFLLHKVLNRKARLLNRTKNEKQAIDILKSNIKNENFDNTDNKARSYSSLGGIYQKINKDSSIYYYNKALNIIKDENNEYLRTLIYFNLGDVYIQQENYPKGLENIKKSEKISLAISDDVGLYYTTGALATYYHNQKKYKRAIELYKKALSSYSKYVDRSEIAHMYWIFSEALYFDDQFKEGFLIQEKYMELKDSLFTVEKSKTFERLQTEYDVEKKNNQIAYLEEKQALEAKQRKLIIGLGGLVLFVLLLLVFLYRYRAKSQKVIRTQEKQLFLQEKEQLKQNEKLKRVEGYIEGEEKEKNRIALELHDGIGGQLSGILHLASSLPNKEHSLALTNNLKTVSKEVRLLSHSLSTSFSELQPFQNLLQTLKERYKNHFSIEIYLFPEEAVKAITNKQKTFLYRSIQEVLNNIYKHAKAELVQLSLTISDEIILVIEDDGIGFNTNKVPNGIGLQNIKERISYLKGEFIIDSKENEGTSVIIKIPKEDEEG
ncbi:tetratricopeptide repeat-containing sensor histidine kinase [uncultured Tenacibaculum sp.]|uniref:tetratricopeptide repeat-containing sensor histidine kinase n=1 Tax=uncultured Tenacibaculum sp. TaxID=174713 RepID=UPI002601C640|nr:tetratricopeptide repeat-containing sensor histidine kinase [uncultured Tenacibaculum sp.]